MPDDLTATLEQFKEHLRAAEAGGLAEWSDGYIPSALYRCLARSVAALEAVLKAHRPSTSDGRCCWCRDADGQRSAWPCGEYLTITRALNGDTE